MSGPPATRPLPTDPGGFQARADGQQVEVRTYEGELIGMVSLAAADDMLRVRLADETKHGLRLKLGIRWLPPRFDRPSGRPDLNQMERRDPGRYAALWRGTLDARVGKGALGRRTIDRSVRFASKAGGSYQA
jgi:hypothetical protein